MDPKTILTTVLLSSASFAALPSNFEMPANQSYPENVTINNRILLKINSKAVTVMDVVRKMDLLFYKQYPELASSPLARYQYYTSGWRTVLGAVIDDQLIMADAEEKQITISDGEVREELERLFGPDVVLNLDNLGMTLDEAFELLKTELIVQRMTGMMVRSKALAEVHPIEIRKKYADYIENNPPKDLWVYQVMSIRGEGHESAAEKARQLLSEQGIPFEEIAHLVQDDELEISFSEEVKCSDQDLSLSYKAILETLAAGAYSTPISKKAVSRIFHLKEFQEGQLTPFTEVAEQIKQELTQQAMVKHNQSYREKLRDHYGLTDSYLTQLIPEDLQPFALR